MDTVHHDPKDDVVAKALLQALLEIHIYQSRHTLEELKQQSLEALSAANVFSPATMAFLKNHPARFYGFPPRIAPDIVVLDLVMAGRHFIGFADGHVKLEVHENRPTTYAQVTA